MEHSLQISVGLCVCLSSALCQNGWSDMDAVWDGKSDGSRNEEGSWVWGLVHRSGNFGSECGAPNCNRGPFEITLGFLVYWCQCSPVNRIVCVRLCNAWDLVKRVITYCWSCDSTLLQRTEWRSENSLFHFSTFLVRANFIIVTNNTSEAKRFFVDLLRERKYYPDFAPHAIGMHCTKMQYISLRMDQPQNRPFPWGIWFVDVTQPTTLNGISIASTVFVACTSWQRDRETDHATRPLRMTAIAMSSRGDSANNKIITIKNSASISNIWTVVDWRL